MNLTKTGSFIMQSMTKIASIMGIVSELDEELIDDILSNVTSNKNTNKRSGSNKPDGFDPFGDLGNKKSSKKSPSEELSKSEKEKILRAFAENSVNVPAIAREQETTINEFQYWNELGVSKELFFSVYNSSWSFKDRIDTIYSLCGDQKYLIENYINRVTV
jgi:hypothetical protein